MNSKDLYAAMNSSNYLTEQEKERKKRELKKRNFFEKYFSCFCTEIYGSLVFTSKAQNEDRLS